MKITNKIGCTFIIILLIISCMISLPELSAGKLKKNRKHMTYVPPGFKLPPVKKLELKNKSVHIDLYSRKFSQGNAVYAEIYSDSKVKKSFSLSSFRFGKKLVPVTKKKWGYRCLFGISPSTRPGIKLIRVIYISNKRQEKAKFNLNVKRTRFPVFKRPLDLGKYSDTRKRTPKEKAFIKESARKKKTAFRHRGKDMITGILSHPRDMHYITSQFWVKRVYMRYKVIKRKKIKMKNRVSIHRGLDLRGEKGTPVFALASGKVVLADELYYEGNMIIIDHGNKIFTYYMHMDDITIKKMKNVKAGDLIGHVGTTGVSTAAHLHVSMLISGVQIDPFSLLPLPIRD